MKNIFLRSLILIVVLASVACEKSLEEVNIDPNTSPTANDAQVLTSAQGFLGYIVDVDLNSNSFLWGQYYTWGIGVSLGNEARFVAQPDDYDGYWGRAYSDALNDLKFLTNSESAAFRGTSKLLTAYIYQGLVDHFGNIPYSEALKGEIADGSNLTPAYDDAASVYTSLISLVDDALSDLENASSSDMGAADLIYGGNVASWRKFGNSLKLRLLMRTSESNPQGDAIKTLISSGDFISSASDVAAIPFDGTAGNENPMYARFEWGVGDFYFASNATLNVLRDLNDPREFAFYSAATTGPEMGNIRGIDQGAVDRDVPFTDPSSDYSGSSPTAYSADNSVILISDWEVWFLRAEAAARYGTDDDDVTSLQNAVSANFNYWGVSGASDYVSSLGYGGSVDNKVDIIGVQKWIALNGTQEDEGWVETRRLDRPASRLFTDGIFQTPPSSVLSAGEFPATWLYPASERALNPNAPAQRQLTDRIFWDN